MTSCLSRFSSLAFVVLLTTLLPFTPAQAANDEVAVEALPHNLGHSLRQLVVWHRAQPRVLSPAERHSRLTKSIRKASRLQTNEDATRVVADVVLDGRVPLASVSESLRHLGIEVFARYEFQRAGSILSTRLPLDLAEAAGQLPGVYSIDVVHKAWRHVGQVTSQGAQVLKTAAVNDSLGFDGTGITVGVLSDSYDQVSGRDHNVLSAAADVVNGDLPGANNPFNHSQEVVVFDAWPGDHYQNDEGRAMLQIIHDLAPGANLVFHRAGNTPADLAAGITALRAEGSPKSLCDVIVDDFGFPEEPMFSDGPAALAAKTVATDLLLPGHPVVYVSSAGNTGDVGYEAEFTPVDVQNPVTLTNGRGNLKLEQVPADLLFGGLHNFNPKPGKVTLAQKVQVSGAEVEISFQWDDPFIPESVTSDYNLLVFDAQGNYLPDLSGTDHNTHTGRAVEVVDLPLGDDDSITYQLAISRRAIGTGEAKHLRYVVNGGDASVKFAGYNHATTFGHNAGPNVIGVAAYAYDRLEHPEYYSSLGPSTIYFDADGKRLATPEVRQQPAVAAVDGVDTSFFPEGPLKSDDGTPDTDTDHDGFPNFFGTSAAAPHVAAVAALLLQAAGGPGSLTPDQVLTFLQTTALPHDLDPNTVSVTLAEGGGSTITLTATADESNAASTDNNVFHLAFNGPGGRFLRKLTINVGTAGLKFDPDEKSGSPFKIGTKVGLQATEVFSKLSPDNSTLTLSFAPGSFTAGCSLNFGLDRDATRDGEPGNSADLLAGTVVKAKIVGSPASAKVQGVLADQTGAGYGRATGFGLVDAEAAVKALLANPPSVAGKALQPGNLLMTTGTNKLIEVTPGGKVVQAITVPDPAGGGESVWEAAVNPQGVIGVVRGTYHPFLIVINPLDGTYQSFTAPNWNFTRPTTRVAGEVVSIGKYFFSNYNQSDSSNPLGLLLRIDPSSGAVQAFGERSTSSSNYKAYDSLAPGPDGLLYAIVDLGGIGAGTSGTPVDVYDPETLQLVRTIYLAPTDAQPTFFLADSMLAIGPVGEIYTFQGGPFTSAVLKYDTNGQLLSRFDLLVDTDNNHSWSSLRTNAQGEIVVGADNPLLIAPNFKDYTVLRVSTTPMIHVAAFVP